MRFSKRIGQIAPSETLSITAEAKAMAARGEDVVILAAGEPDFDTPAAIKEAAIKAIRDGKTKYTPASGTKTLKEAISRKLRNDNKLDYEISEIVVSCGAKHSIYNVLQVICSPGDEVLILSPFWLSYPEMVKLADAKPKIINAKKENGFKAGPKDIKKALSRKTRAIIINSPSNPAGVVYNEKELCAIADICVSKGISIISDEIYEKIIFDGERHFSIAQASAEAKALTIVVNGVSKSYSMTGWRIGYAAGPKKIMEMVSTLQSQSTSNPCSISQAAAEYALNSGLDDEIKRNSRLFEERRNKLMVFLSGGKKIIPFKPTGAFYLFCDISKTGLMSGHFAKQLLKEKKVAIIPGGPFGEDDFIRVSFAADIKALEEGAKRIKEWCE